MQLEGFKFLSSEERRKRTTPLNREPLATLSAGGYLIFNVSASQFLEGYEAALVGYNPKDNILAVVPKKIHDKKLGSLRLSRMGPNRTSRAFSFKAFSRSWNIPTDGSSYPVRWNEERRVLFIDLNLPRPK